MVVLGLQVVAASLKGLAAGTRDETLLEISERLGYHESGVERVRAAIRAVVQAMMADDRPTRG